MLALNKKIKSLLWRSDYAKATPFKRWLIGVTRYIYALSRDLFGGQLSLHAMSLVYSTLLATVPLIAFSFSVLKGLNLHLQLEPLLLDFVSPLGEQGERLTNEVMGMVNKVSGGVLGGLSLSIFLYTAVSMVQKVETSFNYVWHVSQPRGIARRIVDYATVLLIGPLVMALALASLASLGNNALVQSVTDSSLLSPLMSIISRGFPLALVIILFTALYKWMPNTRVQWLAAIIGGLTAGCLWALLGFYFKTFVVYSTRALVIYAGFAIAITTLLWLYANWLILLLGARLAFYFQNRAYLLIGRHDPSLSVRTRESLALDIMSRIGSAFRDRRQDVTTRSLARELALPGIIVGAVVEQLEQAGMIAATDTEALIPATDIHQMTLSEIVRAVREEGDSGLAQAPSWSPKVSELATTIDNKIHHALGDLTLATFITAPDSTDDS
ncbi:MAG: YihY/virulence factor BrkB family protein [Pseudomonadota bacterium]